MTKAYRQTTRQVQKLAALALRKPSYIGENVGVNTLSQVKFAEESAIQGGKTKGNK